MRTAQYIRKFARQLVAARPLKRLLPPRSARCLHHATKSADGRAPAPAGRWRGPGPVAGSARAPGGCRSRSPRACRRWCRRGTPRSARCAPCAQRQGGDDSEAAPRNQAIHRGGTLARRRRRPPNAKGGPKATGANLRSPSVRSSGATPWRALQVALRPCLDPGQRRQKQPRCSGGVSAFHS